MVHQLLPAAVALGFNGWDSGDPEDGEDSYRLLVKKKAWRCKSYFERDGTCIRSAILTWSGQPVDALWHRLQHLDEKHLAVKDAVNPDTSPFRDCLQRLCAMLRGCSGDGVDLAPLWFRYSDADAGRTSLQTELRHNILSVSV